MFKYKRLAEIMDEKGEELPQRAESRLSRRKFT
jgi:hypothetical protein